MGSRVRRGGGPTSPPIHRQRLDLRGADGQIRVEKVGEADPVGLRGRPSSGFRRRRRTAPAGLDDFKGGFLATIDKTFRDATINPKNQVERIGPKACDLHDLGDAAAVQAAELGARLDVIELNHNTTYSAAMRDLSRASKAAIRNPMPAEPGEHR